MLPVAFHSSLGCVVGDSCCCRLGLACGFLRCCWSALVLARLGCPAVVCTATPVCCWFQHFVWVLDRSSRIDLCQEGQCNSQKQGVSTCHESWPMMYSLAFCDRNRVWAETEKVRMILPCLHPRRNGTVCSIFQRYNSMRGFRWDEGSRLHGAKCFRVLYTKLENPSGHLCTLRKVPSTQC